VADPKSRFHLLCVLAAGVNTASTQTVVALTKKDNGKSICGSPYYSGVIVFMFISFSGYSILHHSFQEQNEFQNDVTYHYSVQNFVSSHFPHINLTAKI
jgi:hypothetical protein